MRDPWGDGQTNPTRERAVLAGNPGDPRGRGSIRPSLGECGPSRVERHARTSDNAAGRVRTDEAPTEGIGTMADAPRVFLSYSHDSDEHADRVFALADTLRDRGINVILDDYVPAPAKGWPRWMDRNLDAADFVLMVCTETYRRRAMGLEEPGKGLGVGWEGNLIYNRIYHDQPSASRFIPILLPGSEPAHIPSLVQGHTYYRIAAFDLTDPGFEALYQHLTGQVPTPQPDPNLASVSASGAPVFGSPPDICPIRTLPMKIFISYRPRTAKTLPIASTMGSCLSLNRIMYSKMSIRFLTVGIFASSCRTRSPSAMSSWPSSAPAGWVKPTRRVGAGWTIRGIGSASRSRRPWSVPSR